jgi:hypothetical protein
LRCVPTRKAQAECIGQLEQAFQKLVNPGLWQVLGQGERQKCRDRGAAHGSDIAETAGQAAMAHGFGWMPLPPEMNSFQAEIGGDQGFVTNWNFEDGAIIPDAGGYASPSGSSTPDARDQRSFGERHNGPTI